MGGFVLKIAILLYENMTALDAIGPYEVLSRLPDADVRFTAVQKGLVRSDTGFLGLHADHDISEVTQADLLLVRMTGIFRRREVDAFKENVIKEIGGQNRNVVLDLSGVKYLNSYGLACLVEMGTRQREKGLHLRAFGASGTVLKLLRLVGSESPIEGCASEEEASRF